MSATVQHAKSLIRHADLSPSEHQCLIEDFIGEAQEPERAAALIIRRLETRDESSREEALRLFKADWEELLLLALSPHTVTDRVIEQVLQRDGRRCTMSPRDRDAIWAPQVVNIVSPSLVGIWAGDLKPRLPPIIDAFLGTTYTNTLRCFMSSTECDSSLANMIVLTPSLAHALQRGHIQLRPAPKLDWDLVEEDMLHETRDSVKYHIYPVGPYVQEDMSFSDGTRVVYSDRDDWRFILNTEDPLNFPLPSPFLFKIQYLLAKALRRFYVERQIAADSWGPLQSPKVWGRCWQLFFRKLWYLVPSPLRRLAYRQLLARGRYSDVSSTVMSLPFGLYAKRTWRSHGNEIAALSLLERKASSVPAPLFIDTIPVQDYEQDRWLIMTKVPGDRVMNTLFLMSYPERQLLAQDLRSVLETLWKIPNRTGFAVTGPDGGPIYDGRAASPGACGPYLAEADFNTQISRGRRNYLMSIKPNAFSKTHRSVFTHSDLFLSNVLVDGGRLSGIVDWECAGFFPAYWDYTKAMFGAFETEKKELFAEIYGDEFQEELEVEQVLWKVFPFGGPGVDEEERDEWGTGSDF